MESLNLASGDSNSSPNPGIEDEEISLKSEHPRHRSGQGNETLKQEEITITNINENELKLKDRIAQCRNIIESLKFELYEEKAKLRKETNAFPQASEASSIASDLLEASTSNHFVDSSATKYSACVDNKLNYDENLMEYEKQLQKYQNTLNMAQLEKKNAIRKQMLAKAYRLKLMEVENQCNIELLRVKQSLQCLEPLQMIASKWKNSTEDTYDLNSFELLPRCPELNMIPGCDINSFKDDSSTRAGETSVTKEDFTFNC